MRKLFVTLLFSFFMITGFSQIKGGNISPNILGEPFEGQHFKGKNDIGAVEGDPLLFSDWKSGEVTLLNNEKYRVEKINLDASSNKFIYLMNDTMFEFFDNVKEIRIYNEGHLGDANSDMVFKTGINPEDGNFVQVLLMGKITIFQQYNKQPEGENYSNGIVNHERKYVLHSTKNAIVNNKVVPIKFSSSVLEALTADKKNQVAAYVKENNLKLKKEDDFLKAISYYNTISDSNP